MKKEAQLSTGVQKSEKISGQGKKRRHQCVDHWEMVISDCRAIMVRSRRNKVLEKWHFILMHVN